MWENLADSPAFLLKKSTCQLTGTKNHINFLIRLECSSESSKYSWLPSPVRC
jgi:hypothetical protein